MALAGVLDRKKVTSKNILLINPPSPFLEDERVFPPLGLLSIASVAREDGHNVRLLDLAAIPNYQKITLDEAKSRDYDLIGFTATSPQFPFAYELAKDLRKAGTKSKIVIGGPHPSIVASLRKNKTLDFTFADPSLRTNPKKLEEMLNDFDPNFKPLEEAFDLIISGEENGLAKAFEDHEDKWIDGGIYEDLDRLPMPARDMVDMKSYLMTDHGRIKFSLKGKPTTNVMTQRGCPFDCYFCCGRDVAQFRQLKAEGKLRVLSPEKLLTELNHIRDTYGIESFMFYDDEFNLNYKRTMEACKALEGKGFQLRGFVKGELLAKHPDIGEAMKKAGFVEILTGIESGSDRILRYHVKKHTTPEVNYQAARVLLKNGIGLKALCMLGHPTETYDDVMATKEFNLKAGREFKEQGIDFVFDLTIHQPYPGAPVYDEAKPNTGKFSDRYRWYYPGLYLNKDDFSKTVANYKGVPGEYHSAVRTDALSAEQFIALRDSVDNEIRDLLGMRKIAREEENVVERQYDHSMGQGLALKHN